MDKPLAVVSGATKGIGLAISKKLVSMGYFVIGTYVSSYDPETLHQLESDHFKLYQVNASDYEKTQDFAKDIKNRYGNVSLLVNNAGIVKDNLLIMMKEDEFDRVIDVNLKGVFNMSKAFSRQLMKSDNASIINIASVIGMMGNVGQSNYAAAKAGVIGFSKSLAKELASRQVRVNAIAPGFIETEMTDTLEASLKDKILENIPLKRLGQTQDIADTVAFLVNANYITGQTISVCGGLNI